MNDTAAGAGDSAGTPAVNLHLQQLLYLREVARRGGISRAAEALGVSQPALSQSLTEIARRLDTQLLQQVGRRKRLTASGEEVVRYAEETLAGAAALKQRLDQLRDGEGGTLRVGMIDAASLYVLPEVVRRHREAHPGVELKVTVNWSDELLRRLRAFELDLAFVVGPVEELELSSIPVMHEPLHVYAPSSDPGDVEAAQWVLYPEGSRTRRIIDSAFAAAGIRPSVALESDNPSVLRQMVAMGLGWSVLPRAIGGDETHPSAVQRREALTQRVLCAVQRRENRRDPRVEAFLTLALNRAGADLHEGSYQPNSENGIPSRFAPEIPAYDAVRAHVVAEGRVLLGWNASRSVWTTFGGKSEAGETVEQTLRRELREELGINPTRLQRLNDRSLGWDGEPTQIAVFAVTLWDGVAQNLARHEHETIAWFSAEQISALPLADEARREALELLAK